MLLGAIQPYHSPHYPLLKHQFATFHPPIVQSTDSLHKIPFSARIDRPHQGAPQLDNTHTLARTSFVKKLPFYYGWIILVVSSLGILASIPGQTMGVSVFTDHLIKALGISRVNISTAYMVGTLASSLVIPYAGALLDRKGARKTASFAAIGLIISLLMLSKSPAISSLSPFSPTISGFAVATIGFLGIRFFGQGVTAIVARTMLARWFGSRRGLVVGIMGVVTAFGFSYAPQPLQAMVARYGWSGAMGMLALLLLVVYFPIVLVFYRSDPESVGMEVEEGLPERTLEKTALNQDSEVEYTVREAKRQPRYWVMMVTLGAWTLFTTAFTFHIVSIHREIGIPAEEAVTIFLPISIISVIAQFIGSYASDRIRIKWLFLIFTVTIILSSLSMTVLKYSAGRGLLIVAYGIGNGLFSMLSIVAWPKLFGRRHLGSISGFAMSLMVAGSAIGPWLFSLAYNHTGSYAIIGTVGAVAGTVLLLISMMLPFSHPITQAAPD